MLLVRTLVLALACVTSSQALPVPGLSLEHLEAADTGGNVEKPEHPRLGSLHPANSPQLSKRWPLELPWLDYILAPILDHERFAQREQIHTLLQEAMGEAAPLDNISADRLVDTERFRQANQHAFSIVRVTGAASDRALVNYMLTNQRQFVLASPESGWLVHVKPAAGFVTLSRLSYHDERALYNYLESARRHNINF